MSEAVERTLSAKGRARRDQIIEVAGRLFGQRGYGSVSLRDIATEAGITHPLLVHYFRSKEELLHAVIESWRERAARHGLVDAEGYEGLPSRVVELAEENAEVPGYIALFAGLSSDAVDPEHPAHELFLDQYRTVYESLFAFFRHEEARGALRHGVDPSIAARSLIALEDGAQVQWLYHPDEVDVPELVRAYLELVLVDPFPARS